MLLRIRTRDGLERVTVDDGATVGTLRSVLEETLSIPEHVQTLSMNQDVLLAGADLSSFRDMCDDKMTLARLGVKHGTIVHCAHDIERNVARTVKPNTFRKMTMDDLIAQQTRIERQEQSDCTSLSVDRNAANAFQSYLNQLAFHKKRMGWMYGTIDDANNVRVDAIYEPPQEGDDVQVFEEDDGGRHLAKADAVAAALGMRRVGLIFSQGLVDSDDEIDFTVNAAELTLMAKCAAAEGMDKTFVTAVVKPERNVDDGQVSVSFEAFQCSRQCVDIYTKGWFAPMEAYDEEKEGAGSGSDEDGDGVDVGRTKFTQDVVHTGKDVREVENDFFLCVVKILDHEGPFTSTFPIENRLIPQGVSELREHLAQGKSVGKPYVKRISDYHLLLFLSRHMDSGDIALLAEAVRSGSPVQDGYQLIIDAMCGL